MQHYLIILLWSVPLTPKGQPPAYSNIFKYLNTSQILIAFSSLFFGIHVMPHAQICTLLGFTNSHIKLDNISYIPCLRVALAEIA